MQFQRNTIPAIEQLSGHENDIILVAGQSLRIESSPGGEEILDSGVVPAGKVWTFAIGVDCRETDA